ncbi:MAG: GTPase Era [Chloroflexota bacterium]
MPTKAGYMAIIGKPNVGKSTLMNAAIGAKLSIVTDKPQTTRKRVLGISTRNDTQIVFVDTPGILKPRYEMQRSMMGYVSEALETADAITVMIDAPKIDRGEKILPDEVLETLIKLPQSKILLINKIDEFKDVKLSLPIIQSAAQLSLFQEILPVSALKGVNVDKYLQIAESIMPEGEFYYDPEILSSQPERFFTSELIREQVFQMFSEEVPYSTEVSILEFKERAAGKWFIHAEIIVEKDTQKAIILGKGGVKIKELGERARRALENHFELPVYLELFVKVREKWRSKPGMLKSFGY